jgi:hypothetical protein
VPGGQLKSKPTCSNTPWVFGHVGFFCARSVIAKRASEKFGQRGGGHGHHEKDWLEAKKDKLIVDSHCRTTAGSSRVTGNGGIVTVAMPDKESSGKLAEWTKLA